MSTILDRPATVTREEVLLHAADLIENLGHAKGARGMPSHKEYAGPLCFLGAVAQARMELGLPAAETTHEEYLLASEALRIGRPEAWHWNDAHDRTPTEVVDRLRELAAA